MSVGPLHILVFGFDQPTFTGAALAELRRLEASDTVRLVDLVFVQKFEDGTVEAIEVEDLDPELALVLGDLAGPLVGLGDEADAEVEVDEEVWDIAEEIPPGSAAAVVILEHRWAIGLRDAIAGAGGQLLGDALIPSDELAQLGEDFEAAVQARA